MHENFGYYQMSVFQKLCLFQRDEDHYESGPRLSKSCLYIVTTTAAAAFIEGDLQSRSGGPQPTIDTFLPPNWAFPLFEPEPVADASAGRNYCPTTGFLRQKGLGITSKETRRWGLIYVRISITLV